jgi:VanZ family protein
MFHLRFWRILAIVVAVSIAVLSLLPKPPEIHIGVRFADKITHFAAYLVLSFLLFASIFKEKRTGTALVTILTVSALCLFYGSLIEILQMLTGRRPEIWDLATDVIGAICGALIGSGLRRHLHPYQA